MASKLLQEVRHRRRETLTGYSGKERQVAVCSVCVEGVHSRVWVRREVRPSQGVAATLTTSTPWIEADGQHGGPLSCGSGACSWKC